MPILIQVFDAFTLLLGNTRANFSEGAGCKMELWIDFQQSLPQRLIREELDQEQTRAKNFSLNGHALVRGVAGSGKSLVLRSRVEKLLEDGITDILVLSYNRFMQGWLQHKLTEKASLTIECRTFHAWAWQEFKYRYESDSDPKGRQQLLELAKQSGLNYQAILVDEAQDFFDDWFVSLLTVLSAETNSLFFVYDNTQSVYGKPHRRRSDWTWKNLGIDITGRSQIFDLNYRNSPEILETAWSFILPALESAGMKVAKREEARGTIGTIIEPKTKRSRSSDIQPLLVQLADADLPATIAQQVKWALKQQPESSIGILTHPEAKALRSAISKQLKLGAVPHHAPQTSGERNFNAVNRPTVVVDSWNAVKGVEFDAVILAGLDRVPELDNPDLDFQTKSGLYTAMTRARDHLVMLHQQETVTVDLIARALSNRDRLESEA